MNNTITPMENIIATVYCNLPPHNVRVQLQIFTPVGMAMSMVATENTATLTGFHGVHVTLGIIMLLTLVGIINRGKVTGDKAEVVELVGLYWHFVDVVWVVIFTLVYLIPS